MLKKTVTFLFVSGVLASSISNASASTFTSTLVPKPYTLAVQQFNEGYFNYAQQYAELTIKNFPKSIYAYRAHVIEAAIINSGVYWINQTLDQLSNGKSKGSSLLSHADNRKIKSEVQSLFNLAEKKYAPQIRTLAAYIIHNMPKSEWNYQYSNLNYYVQVDDTQTQGVTWFGSVGYPIPTSSEMQSYEGAILDEGIMGNEGNLRNKQPMANFLYETAVSLYNLNLKKENYPLIRSICARIEYLLKGDPYNKLNLEVKDLLSKI